MAKLRDASIYLVASAYCSSDKGVTLIELGVKDQSNENDENE